MRIAIIGNVDKRVVAYPLMRALAVQGKTAVITDDTSFRRLFIGEEDKGIISNVKVLVVPDIKADSDSGVDNISETIVNEVFISNHRVEGLEVDKTVIVRGIDRSMSILRDEEDDIGEEIVEQEEENTGEEEIKEFEIVVTTENNHRHDGDVHIITGDDLKSLWEIEEHKELLKVSKGLVKLVINIVEDIYDIGRLEAEKLINRDLIEVGK